MKRVGIIGGAGYTAGELLRLLVNHPEAEIAFVHSTSNAGNPVTAVHSGLEGECDLLFSGSHPLNDIDTLFLCSGHGQSTRFWQENALPPCLQVIDLAQDFRDESDGYVYGLPELNRDRIARARKVANPGCFATALQLAILPLAAASELVGDINVTAITGSTGAGVKPGATTHFSWRSGNLSVYKAFTHQHLDEISRSIVKLQPGFDHDINFVPVRGDFPRGIFAMTTLTTNLGKEELGKLYDDYYGTAAFTLVSDRSIDLKQVVNTNKALIHLQKNGNRLLVVSAIDNLLKGASGQAVQNFNIMNGFDERLGLRLKALAF